MFDPRHMNPPIDAIESLERYAKQGVPPGGFLRAVLANDLMEAVGRADIYNIHALPAICSYIYNGIPLDSWGSYEIVDNWIEKKHKEQQDGS